MAGGTGGVESRFLLIELAADREGGFHIGEFRPPDSSAVVGLRGYRTTPGLPLSTGVDVSKSVSSQVVLMFVNSGARPA